MSLAAMLFWLGLPAATAVNAQAPSSAVQQDAANWHHQMRYNAMKDMSEVMSEMTQQMSRGELAPAQRQQMVQRMRRMSKMMDLMSGWEDAPAMKEPEMKKQMVQMREEMDEMMREMKLETLRRSRGQN